MLMSASASIALLFLVVFLVASGEGARSSAGAGVSGGVDSSFALAAFAFSLMMDGTGMWICLARIESRFVG
ncbi:hypothetical protein FB451DRAFT_1290367 [Mycena latifolia]|nr:hypothetical protein FB451DRAFT_1290367 [Mycena latifolia]